MRLSRRAALALFAALPMAAARPAFAALPADDQAAVDRAAAYLDGLTSLKSRFTQIDEAGHVDTGEVWLARPGRARFQYDPPSGLLLVCDGQWVVLSDSRLKTRQRFPLSSTPLAAFLADHIRLDRGVKITRVDREAAAFSITARSGSGLAQGEITLYFAETPVRLTGWVIVDAQARATRVTLGPLEPVPAPPASLFTAPPA